MHKQFVKNQFKLVNLQKLYHLAFDSQMFAKCRMHMQITIIRGKSFWNLSKKVGNKKFLNLQTF